LVIERIGGMKLPENNKIKAKRGHLMVMKRNILQDIMREEWGRFYVMAG
jgi:hypothetical protein